MHTRILYQSARLCLGPSYCDPVTPAIRSLHWLALCVYICFRLAPLVYRHHVQIVSHLTYLSWPNLATLLKTASVFHLHLLEYTLHLVPIFGWCPSTVAKSSYGTIYLFIFTTLLARLSFVLN